MNGTALFMAGYGVLAVGGAVSFALSKQWPLAFVWTCYAAAQVGWVWQAMR